MVGDSGGLVLLGTLAHSGERLLCTQEAPGAEPGGSMVRVLFLGGWSEFGRWRQRYILVGLPRVGSNPTPPMCLGPLGESGRPRGAVYA